MSAAHAQTPASAPASTPASPAAVASPAAKTGGPAIDQLKAFLQGTKSARGEFSQKTVSSKAIRGGDASTKDSSGKFSFLRPGQFRWEITKPYEQLLIADGKTLQFYDADLNQVSVRKWTDVPTASPAAILFGSRDPNESFHLQDQGRRDGLDWLEAVPKKPDSGFDRLAIGFKDGVPLILTVQDSFGQTTVIALNKLERNVSLGADQFKFVPPKGADVVHADR